MNRIAAEIALVLFLILAIGLWAYEHAERRSANRLAYDCVEKMWNLRLEAITDKRTIERLKEQIYELEGN